MGVLPASPDDTGRAPPPAGAPANPPQPAASRPATGPLLPAVESDEPPPSPWHKRLLMLWVVPPVAFALLWLLRATWRVRQTGREQFERAAAEGRSVAVAFLHGRSFMLLNTIRGRRRGQFLSMCSKSLDGDAMARVEEWLGFDVIRGSTGRDGMQAMVDMIRRVRAKPGLCACLAVDGSRGPRGRVQGGVIALAQRTGGLVVPITVSARPAFIFRKAWDRTLLALPFARVEVVFGELLEVPLKAKGPEFSRLCLELEERLVAAQAQADALSGFGDSEPVRAEA